LHCWNNEKTWNFLKEMLTGNGAILWIKSEAKKVDGVVIANMAAVSVNLSGCVCEGL